MNKHENLPYLNHILDAINDIETSVNGISEIQFKNHKDIKDANIRRIEIIGEAVKNISHELKQQYPKVEWKKIAGTRDIMIHGYFNVDLGIAWRIIKEHLPVLKRQILNIKEDLESKGQE